MRAATGSASSRDQDAVRAEHQADVALAQAGVGGEERRRGTTMPMLNGKTKAMRGEARSGVGNARSRVARHAGSAARFSSGSAPRSAEA